MIKLAVVEVWREYIVGGGRDMERMCRWLVVVFGCGGGGGARIINTCCVVSNKLSNIFNYIIRG